MTDSLTLVEYQGNNVNNAELTVINNSNADFEAPVLSSFTVSPSTVDISSGAVSVTASIRATDASGVIAPTSSGAYVYYQERKLCLRIYLDTNRWRQI